MKKKEVDFPVLQAGRFQGILEDLIRGIGDDLDDYGYPYQTRDVVDSIRSKIDHIQESAEHLDALLDDIDRQLAEVENQMTDL